MQTTVNQFLAEEQIIIENLQKNGLSQNTIEEKLTAVKDPSPENKPNRNILIKEIADIMKGKKCALQPWFIYEVLGKVSGLSPNTIQIISNTNHPDRILKAARIQA